jgi:hypothetical protein
MEYVERGVALLLSQDEGMAQSNTLKAYTQLDAPIEFKIGSTPRPAFVRMEQGEQGQVIGIDSNGGRYLMRLNGSTSYIDGWEPEKDTG